MKEPKVIQELDRTFNKVIATGQIKRFDFRGENYDFYQSKEKDGRTIYSFLAKLWAIENSIKLVGFNTTKNPAKAKNLANAADEGDWVEVIGQLNEYETASGTRVRQINVADGGIKLIERPKNPKFKVIMKGKITEYSEEDDRVKLKIGIPRFGNPDIIDEFAFVGATNNEYIQWLIKQNPSVGDVIDLEAQSIYINKRNDNNEYETKNYNLIEVINGYGKGNGDVTVNKKNDEPDNDDLPF